VSKREIFRYTTIDERGGSAPWTLVLSRSPLSSSCWLSNKKLDLEKTVVAAGYKKTSERTAAAVKKQNKAERNEAKRDFLVETAERIR
jgi:hypothetical protein